MTLCEPARFRESETKQKQIIAENSTSAKAQLCLGASAAIGRCSRYSPGIACELGCLREKK
jgi:hypothetical protein